MPYQDNDDLRRAMDSLDVFTVWRAAYRDGVVTEPAPDREGVYRSPFREDGSRPSFSVINGGRGWKDHGGAGAKGGVWHFVQRCWPNESKQQTAKRVIELSGITPTPAPSRSSSAGGASGGAPGDAAAVVVDPSLVRAAKSIEKKRRAAELEERVYEEHRKKLLPPVYTPVGVAPDFVAERWEEGVEHLAQDRSRAADVAKGRGWPVQWVDELAVAGLMGYPWERMATPGTKWAARQKAFAVQQPRLVREVVELEAVGYHQQWYVPARGGQPAQKGWMYVPCVPKARPRSKFEEQLVTWCAAERGVSPAAPKSVVPALPFVIGDLRSTRLIVLLEGQWDAITFYGACGWFHDTTPANGVAVFGIRGAQGLDVFLGAWALWLRRTRPRVWVIADNDAAGGSWREQPPAEPGLPRPPSLGDRLIAAGCRGGERDEAAAPVVSWLKAGGWGKDFNDYFKACNGKLGPEKMRAWARSLGLDLDGGCA